MIRNIGKHVRHIKNVVVSILRERNKVKKRSPEWIAIRGWYLHHFPKCAACGIDKLLQVHHKIPFHDRPDLELVDTNLITLCMSKNECHLRIGHGDNWKAYNPDVAKDSEILFKNPDMRYEYEQKAKAMRVA